MSNQLNKLNKYNKHPETEKMYTGKSGREHAFQRFQWVLDGKLARSARPYYSGAKGHTLERHDVYFLATQGITCVISAYQTDMDEAGKTALRKAGIAFHSFPVPDFKAPTAWELWEAARLIDAHRTTLFYCGYGEGRTGTFVAAWAKLKQTPLIKGMNDFGFLKANFGVERPCQAQILNTLVPNGPEPAYARSVVQPPGPASSGPGAAGGIPAFANFGSGGSDTTFVGPISKPSSGGIEF